MLKAPNNDPAGRPAVNPSRTLAMLAILLPAALSACHSQRGSTRSGQQAGYDNIERKQTTNSAPAGKAAVGEQMAEIEAKPAPYFWDLNCPKTCIDREKNQELLDEQYAHFDPKLRSMLRSTQLLKSGKVRTAAAHTTPYLREKGDYVHMLVSNDWDNQVKDSPYVETYLSYGKKPEDPAFSDDFKRNLLAHEFLHIVADQEGLDMNEFFRLVEKWYKDDSSGPPGSSHGQNYTKYTLYHHLYGKSVDPKADPKAMEYRGSTYADASRGVEEFAYIGQAIIDRGSRALADLSPEIREFYRGILKHEYLDNSKSK